MHVDDFAALVVECVEGAQNSTVDAVGPETFEYRALAATLAEILAVRRKIVSVPPALGYLVARALSPFVGDVILTREEIEGLMRGLLCSDTTRTGTRRLTEWAHEHRSELGRQYASELRRRIERDLGYEPGAGSRG
jgi:NADH dehydrogenase